MRITISRIISLTWYIPLLVLLCFNFALAQQSDVTSPLPGGDVTSPNLQQNNNTSSVGPLQNPLGNKTLMQFMEAILDVIIIFAVPIIVFFIIYAGFLYVTARGNETTIGQAHRALTYAVIGGVLILGAQVLLVVIKGTIEAFK